MFLLGVGVFTGASLLCGLAPGPIALIAARALQGAGAALMFPQALTGIQLTFEGAERARAIGLYAIALSSGAVAGQVLGGVLVSADVLGGAVALDLLRQRPRGRWPSSRPAPATSRARASDARRGASTSPACHAVGRGAARGRAARPRARRGLAGVDLAEPGRERARLRRLRRRRATCADARRTPLVSLDAMAPRAVSSGMLAVAAATSTYYGLLFTLALYLQQGLGRSALVSGLTLVSWVVAFGAAGQIVRRLPPRFGPLAAPAGCLLLAGAYMALSASLFAGRHAEALLVVLLGAGGWDWARSSAR